MQKIPKNSQILKNDGHFRIPHPQISFQTFAKMQLIFYYEGGWNYDIRFSQNNKIKKKKKKMVSLVF